MCGSGAALGAILGYALAPVTGGASLALAAGAGALAGDTLVDKPAEAAKKGLEAQQAANATAIDAATKQASAADQATNRANAKVPDIASMLSENVLNAKGGQSGTMLTGPQGVDPNALLLGKKTLLGG